MPAGALLVPGSRSPRAAERQYQTTASTLRRQRRSPCDRCRRSLAARCDRRPAPPWESGPGFGSSPAPRPGPTRNRQSSPENAQMLLAPSPSEIPTVAPGTSSPLGPPLPEPVDSPANAVPPTERILIARFVSSVEATEWMMYDAAGTDRPITLRPLLLPAPDANLCLSEPDNERTVSSLGGRRGIVRRMGVGHQGRTCDVCSTTERLAHGNYFQDCSLGCARRNHRNGRSRRRPRLRDNSRFTRCDSRLLQEGWRCNTRDRQFGHELRIE